MTYIRYIQKRLVEPYSLEFKWRKGGVTSPAVSPRS